MLQKQNFCNTFVYGYLIFKRENKEVDVEIFVLMYKQF